MSEAFSEASPAPRQMRDRFTFLLIIVATFGLQFLALVSGIIMARLLGVEGRGLVALVIAIGLFASQLTFGGSLPAALTKLLAERQVTARDGLRDIARRRAWLVLVPCVAAAGLVLVLQRSESDRAATTVIVFVVTLQTVVFQILAGCLQGEARLVRMAWVSLAPQLSFTVILAVVVVVGWEWSALDVLYAYLASGLASLVLVYASLLRPRDRPEDQLSERAVWSEARKNYVSSVRPLDGLGLDRILVGGLLGTAPLGLFAAGAAVSNLCRLISNAVSVIVLPRVAMHHADAGAQREVIRRWLAVTAVLVVAIVATLEVLVEPVIRLAFGEEFVGAVDCARWLILADGLLAFRKVLISVLQGQGRGDIASWIELAILPVLLVGIVLAAQADSLVGVGVSLTAAGLLSCLAMGWAVARGPRARRRGPDAPGRHALGRPVPGPNA